jgi:hypothetical protein
MRVVEARVWLVPPMVTPLLRWRAGSEGTEECGWVGRRSFAALRMTVVEARDDRAALLAALCLTRAHNTVTLREAKGLARGAARSFAALRMTVVEARDDRAVLPA